MLLTWRRAPLSRFPANLALFFVGALAASGVAGCKHKSRHEATTGQASRGEAIFRTRCAVCHSTGEASAQGPGLAHVVGRRAASARGFGYSPAMRASALTWDASTLDRFLASPAQVVPATTMPIRVPSASDRRELIAFLSTLHGSEAPARSAAPARPTPGDFQADAPGVRHHLTLADLPPPFATESARNAPEVVARPDGALPHVPAGFTVDLFASDLTNPRAIRVAPNGDVFVAESAAGQIRVLRAKDGAKTADTIEVFATGLDRPFGLAFYPPGPSPRWVYVANTSSVVRFPYRAGDLHAVGPAAVVVPALGGTGGHWPRDFS